jgi:hypothetical protein
VLGAPAGDLRGFPASRLARTTTLFRVHPVGLGPWWFSSGGQGRFDLSAPRGTCYLSLSPLGAFVEVFRDFAFVDAADVSRRRISKLQAPRDLVLADCTSSRARRFGLTAQIHSTPAYETTRSWAMAFSDAAFDGVRYFCGQDPSQRETGIAVFGGAGETDWPVAETTRIADEVLFAVERRFGIHVLPAR